MKRFLVRSNDGKWDEVTEYVYSQRKFVTDTAGITRYGDQSIVVEGTSFTISGTILAGELGKLCRYLDVTIPVGTFPALVNVPESVQIVRGNSTKLHVLKTGVNWTKTAAKTIPATEERKAA